MSRNFVTAVHRALNVPAGNGDALTALAAVMAAAPDDPARRAALTRLAQVLAQGSRPGALAELLTAGATVLNAYRYERVPGWPFGTHASRRRLVEELWAEGKAAGDADLARGAFLLAAEQGFPYGTATMAFLLDEIDFALRTGWTAEQAAGVRTLLEDARGRTVTFVAEAGRAARAIEQIIADPAQLDDGHVQAFLAAVEQIAKVAGERPDIQMRLANLTWRVANLARARQRPDVVNQLVEAAARWSAGADEPHYSRWLSEAVYAPQQGIRTSGARRGTAAEMGIRRNP